MGIVVKHYRDEEVDQHQDRTKDNRYGHQNPVFLPVGIDIGKGQHKQQVAHAGHGMKVEIQRAQNMAEGIPPRICHGIHFHQACEEIGKGSKKDRNHKAPVKPVLVGRDPVGNSVCDKNNTCDHHCRDVEIDVVYHTLNYSRKRCLCSDISSYL